MSIQKIEEFLSDQNKSIQLLYKPILYNHWMSATTGDKEWSDKHEQSLKEYYAYFADQEAYQKVVAFKKEQSLTALQERQLGDLYNKMVKNQLDHSELGKTLELEKNISYVFNTYRPTLTGKQVTNNALLHILKNSNDNEERKEAWLASKQVGKKIEQDLLKLIHKRNKDAQALGYNTFYEMSLATQELDINTVFNVFQQLKNISDEPFRLMKEEIDVERAGILGVKKEDLRPWHYVDPFFQEAPPVSGVDVDHFYSRKNLEKIVSNTFNAMGLPIDEILLRSDLYPRENKNPFGFCTNIDREGDIRVLVNLDESVFWATALLHEFGHAAYFKYIDKSLPFLLRFHSHSLTTEAIALFFGRLTKNVEWYKRFLEVKEEELMEKLPAIEKMLQRQMLVSARWMMTFSFFERELYENPDQDLNRLWWDLVKDIQYIHPPENTSYPDWASKMHFSLAPATYQDYLLGELMASQLQHYIETNISKDLFRPEVGKFLKDNFFRYGASLQWNEKIKMATGDYLNPVYFIKQFLD
ncbi:M3 family oligoendopeptidase [Bacillus sp. FJAT-49711]|uniref:M3 family metallopeptidase n=1 Tax=Bacillus sp. FJAT-49711 TaxID=2833585 RepID=UPI001BCA2E96|nr:M3 family metallopeptidase [Bacillus sp. FJAT-49711]MBS4218656.1 M3 family oligoendopeptidase [Bacillus sp. FJAT-49711]